MRRDRAGGHVRPPWLRRSLALATGGTLALGLAAPAVGAPPAGPTARRRRRGARRAGVPRRARPAGGPGRPGRPDHRGARRRSRPRRRAPPATRPRSPRTNLDRYRGVVFLSAEGTDAERRAGGGAPGVRQRRRRLPRRRATPPGRRSDSEWFTGLIGTRPAGNHPRAREGRRGHRQRRQPAERDRGEAHRRRPAHQVADPHADRRTITLRLAEAVPVTGYALTSANDSAGRDPQDWTLQGSADGQTWVDLDKRTGESFPDRFQTKDYTFENDQAYAHYRLNITRNAGDAAHPARRAAALRRRRHHRAGAGDRGAEDDRRRRRPSAPGHQGPAAELGRARTAGSTGTRTRPAQVHTVAQVRENGSTTPGKGANGAVPPGLLVPGLRRRPLLLHRHGRHRGQLRRGGRSARHLLGALQWTTGLVRGDCQATIAANYTTERLTATNQPGSSTRSASRTA